MHTAEKASKNSRQGNGRPTSQPAPVQPQIISYDDLRSALIARGTNLARWAFKNRLPIGSVYHAARNTRRGIETTRIRQRLLAYVRN